MISSLKAGQMYAKSIPPLPNGEEQYEFLLTAHTKTGQVVLRFDNSLYSEETARQSLDAYIGLVGTLGQDPRVKIHDVSVVSVTEHDRLVNDLASSTNVPVFEQCLHHLVEEQARRKPRFGAVEFEGESLTYAELNSAANQIAHSLLQQSVGSESVVALCFDRGIQQILAILAVLKAGGTFLLLDPDDPTLLKELVIVDRKAKVLLTTSSHSRDFEKSIASKVLVSAYRFLVLVPN
jgi:Non-ribosomal peptide synthetase modules and related proteins